MKNRFDNSQEETLIQAYRVYRSNLERQNRLNSVYGGLPIVLMKTKSETLDALCLPQTELSLRHNAQ